MRSGLLAGSLALVVLLSLGLAGVVAAQEAVARAEPAAGAVLDRAPARVELWLEEPPSAAGEADVQVVHNQSGRRVDLGGASWDAGGSGHVKVQLRPDLTPGKYVVSWVVGADGREGGGSYSFMVREPLREGNDDLVTIALATFGVAAAAVVVGMVAYLARLRLGLAKAPPFEGGHSG